MNFEKPMINIYTFRNEDIVTSSYVSTPTSNDVLDGVKSGSLKLDGKSGDGIDIIKALLW